MATQKPPAMVEVNLLPGDDLMGRPGGKFLTWALSWGKRIVIVTEAVVILAFLSRFWLDTTVADLAEQIAAEKNIVVASANFEEKWRAVQARVNQANKVENQVSLLLVWDKARRLIPPQVAIKQFDIKSTGVSLSGTSDEQSLAILVSAFRKSPDFTDLSVDKLTKVGPSPTIDFSLKATYAH